MYNKMEIKKNLHNVAHWWPVNLFLRGINLLYLRFFYHPIHRKKYKVLSRYKDCHQGKRCFIVATGPSLQLEDINKLKGEICFGMNSIFKLYDKTEWRPTYYAIIDSSVYRRIKNDIEQIDIEGLFFPDRILDSALVNAHYVPFIDNWCNSAIERRVIPNIFQKRKFGRDMTKRFYAGASVVHFIMQIAFYMGFSEIYLLGTDCSAPNKHSTLTPYKDSDQLGNSPQDIYDGLMQDYEIAKQEAIKRGIKIINATRGGALELFPRVDLDDLLG